MEEIRINSWHEFVKIVDHLDVGSAGKPVYAFRGHAAADWVLRPSLLRWLHSAQMTEDKALQLEKGALAEFQTQAHLHISPNMLSNTTDTVSWWYLMQHHGAPTRLLDWTESIYVAAYFAVSEKLDTDGGIWWVHMDTVHEHMTKQHGYEGFPETEPAIRAFFLEPGGPPVVVFLTQRSKSSRMVAQRGIFSISRQILCDHGSVLGDAMPQQREKELLRKLVIPSRLKDEFAWKLRAMNITAGSLFPGLDGLARSISEYIRFYFRHE